ncbi:MAG: ECF transporter S component [Promethearchaeota archaeon]
MKMNSMLPKADFQMLPKMPKSLLISLAALMAALCCVMTMIFQIYVPATYGYFNLGEVGVYIAALLFGPIIGAIAGGIGSMLADILLGYPHYALATLIIKGLEGFAVGYLSQKFRGRFAKHQLLYLSIFIGLGLAFGLAIIGWLRFSGELYLSGGPETGAWWLTFIIIPSYVWFILAIYIGASTILIAYKYEPEAAWNATAMLIGGFLMITGYFLYQQLVLLPIFSLPVVPLVELPANLMQSIIGIMVALPLTERIRKVFTRTGWFSGN